MNIALVLAGGTGTRLGTDIPKQYIRVNGRMIIDYCLETTLFYSKKSPYINMISVLLLQLFLFLLFSVKQNFWNLLQKQELIHQLNIQQQISCF